MPTKFGSLLTPLRAAAALALTLPCLHSGLSQDFRGVQEPLYPYQYYLHAIEVEDAWKHTSGSPDVIVAIIDEGMTPHPEIPSTRLLPGIDYWDSDDDPTPFGNGSHGMASAGIIGAAHNGLGIAGIAPGVRIIPIRIFDRGDLRGSTRSARMQSIADAIDFAWQNGAAIIYTGWGITESNGDPDHLQFDAINLAIERATTLGRDGLGAVLVAAAGNHANTLGNILAYPASHHAVISVGAVDRSNEKWPYSVASDSLDLVAQSGALVEGPELIIGGCNFESSDFFRYHMNGDVWTTELSSVLDDWEVGWNPGNSGICERGFAQYVWTMDGRDEPKPAPGFTAHFGGTSAAAPQVAGVVALMLALNDQLTWADVKQILRLTATDLATPGCDSRTGCGLVNAADAIAYTLDNFGNTSVARREQQTLELEIFPTPAVDRVTIKFSLKNRDQYLEISDLLGRKVPLTLLQEDLDQYTLDVSGWAPGIYFVRVAASSGPAQTGLLVTQ